MEKTDILYQLIGGMSKAEKRYFRLWVGRTEGEKNYVLLWDAIEKIQNPSDAVLKQKYARQKWINRLPYEKNYLYHQILTCLRVFHEDLNPEVSMYNRLLEIKVLHEKGLYECARKMIEKCLVTARAQQQTLLELELLKMKELNNDVMQDIASINEELPQRLTYKKTLVKAIYERIWVEHLYDTFMLRMKQKKMSDFDRFMKRVEPVIKKLEVREVQSLKVHQLQCHLISMWYLMKHDIEKSTFWLAKMLKILEDNPVLMASNVRSYLSSLTNIGGRYIILQNKDEFYRIITKIRNAPEVFPAQKYQSRLNHSLATSIQLEVLFHIYGNTYLGLRHKIGDLEKLWNKVEPYSGKEQYITHYLTMGSYFFLVKEYKNALKCLSYIFGKKIPADLRPDLQIFARFIRVLIALEREDEKGWEIRRRELRKHLRESAYRNETLEMCMKLLNDIYDTDGISFKPARWQQIHDQVITWLNQREEDMAMFSSTGIISWLKRVSS